MVAGHAVITVVVGVVGEDMVAVVAEEVAAINLEEQVMEMVVKAAQV